MELEKLLNWMNLFTEKVNENKDYLSELDTPIGDGDHGANMARGTKAMMAALEEKEPQTTQEALKIIAMTLISKVGGASGPLYGSAFMGMAKTDEKAPLSDYLEAGFNMIKMRGKSDIHEKTMLDTWHPVIEALKNNELTTEKVYEFAKATKDIKATKGRASYLGERSIGHIDPGAMSSAYFFETMIEAGVINE